MMIVISRDAPLGSAHDGVAVPVGPAPDALAVPEVPYV